VTATVADQGSSPATIETATTAEFFGKSPAELCEVIETSKVTANQIAATLKSGGNRGLRMKEFCRNIETASAAASALARHPESSEAEKQQATLTRLELFYTAAQTDRPSFEPRLAGEVETLLTDNPDSQAVIVGETLLLRLSVLSKEARHEEIMSELEAFSRRHPEGSAGPMLFLEYGEALVRDKRDDEALHCYYRANELFPKSPQLNDVRLMLANYETARRNQLAKEESRRKKIAAIKRRLGYADGYFVLCASEKGKVFYRFEYYVRKGADKTASVILNLRENWKWDCEVVARFPETPDGFKQANRLKKERTRKETAFKAPAFGS
jgi:tetratricopeptide (TPR) repeat protein